MCRECCGVDEDVCKEFVARLAVVRWGGTALCGRLLGAVKSPM